MENFDDKLYFYKAKCVNVVDGDTVDFLVDVGLKVSLKERIRLYGLNSNEIFGTKVGSVEYEAGLKCKNRVIELILNKEIWMQTIKDKQEKYGRYLAIIYFLEGTNYVNLNELLVSENLASKVSY